MEVYQGVKNKNGIFIWDYSHGMYYGARPNRHGVMRGNFPTGDLQPWVDFCIESSYYVAPHVKHFEIWNEPDIGLSLPDYPEPVPVADFIALQKITYETLKPYYPDHKIIAPGMAWERLSDQRWPLSQWVDLGGLDYCDGFSYHPYRYTSPSDPSANHSIKHLDALHDYLVSYGGREVDIYITEVGWPTSMFTAEYQWQQFEFLVEQCHKRPWVKGLWWYDFMNDCPDETNRECTFGLYDQTLLKKYTS